MNNRNQILSVPLEIGHLIVDPNNFKIEKQILKTNNLEIYYSKLNNTGKLILQVQFSENSQKNDPKLYISFIKILSQIQTQYVLQFIGFSNFQPFIIFYNIDHLKRLKDIIHGKKRKLSGTEKTILLIHIIKAILFLNEISIYLPHLSTDVIFIGDDLIPKISLGELNNIDLPYWQSPESIKSGEIDEKNDIFLFSFIIYELLTENIPFKGLTKPEIQKSILVDKLRPSLSKDLNCGLLKIIRKCWSQNKNHRPKLNEILDLLFFQQYQFPNTNSDEINDYFKKIQVKNNSYLKILPDEIESNVLPITPIHSPIKLPLKLNNINLQVFNDYNDPKFLNSLLNIDEILKEDEYIEFFILLSFHLKSSTPINILESILHSIFKLLDFKKCFMAFNQSKIIKFFPFDLPKLLNIIFDILFIIFSNAPFIINNDFLRLLSFLIQSNPEKTLILISLYIKNFEFNDFFWSIIDLLFQFEKLYFSSKSGSEYISLLFYLNFNYEIFYKKKIEISRKIFCNFLKSSDWNVSKLSYNAIFHLFDENYNLPMYQIIADLCDQNLSLSALSILLKLDEIPPHQNLIYPLIHLSQQNKDATLIILKMLKNIETAKVLLLKPDWLNFSLPSPFDTLRIFLRILKFSELNEEITLLKQLPKFLTSLLGSNERSLIVSLNTIFKHLNLKKNNLILLSKTNFFIILFNLINEDEDEGMICLFLDLLITFSKIGFINDYLIFFQFIIESLFKTTRIIQSSFTLIYFLSFYDESIIKFKDLNLINQLKKINLEIIKEENIQKLLNKYC